MSEIQVLIVEDEPVIAAHIAHYLNNHSFKVCGIAYDDEEAKAILETGIADAAILDINLGGGMNGIEIAELINKRYAIPFVFLTSYADKETIEQAKLVKPWGYIVKPFNENTIMATLEIAISNFALTNNKGFPDISLQEINRQLQSHLSIREFEVLMLIYDGKTNQQIAEELFVSINTIKKHINNFYLKLEVASRTAAIARLRGLMKK
ncbi:response regulator [Algoriphagus aestuariicola]|jgi:DNA-binding NarL/FixJ family response regulator|uniref:Response regulator n=1 Tax=Algoriphagus aestuariicola TaxID=1852016 RepID=A0ABS3BKC8_9BACT|nr:response regulator [Algoriphagus aestuariicola]MBN7799279.1 response regulator [Algoriphagus aestuariicola]